MKFIAAFLCLILSTSAFADLHTVRVAQSLAASGTSTTTLTVPNGTTVIVSKVSSWGKTCENTAMWNGATYLLNTTVPFMLDTYFQVAGDGVKAFTLTILNTSAIATSICGIEAVYGY